MESRKPGARAATTSRHASTNSSRRASQPPSTRAGALGSEGGRAGPGRQAFAAIEEDGPDRSVAGLDAGDGRTAPDLAAESLQPAGEGVRQALGAAPGVPLAEAVVGRLPQGEQGP